MTLVSSFLNRSKYFLLAMIMIFLAGNELYSQSWVAEAHHDGFKIKKLVSDTTVATGQPFS